VVHGSLSVKDGGVEDRIALFKTELGTVKAAVEGDVLFEDGQRGVGFPRLQVGAGGYPEPVPRGRRVDSVLHIVESGVPPRAVAAGGSGGANEYHPIRNDHQAYGRRRAHGAVRIFGMERERIMAAIIGIRNKAPEGPIDLREGPVRRVAGYMVGHRIPVGIGGLQTKFRCRVNADYLPVAGCDRGVVYRPDGDSDGCRGAVISPVAGMKRERVCSVIVCLRNIPAVPPALIETPVPGRHVDSECHGIVVRVLPGQLYGAFRVFVRFRRLVEGGRGVVDRADHDGNGGNGARRHAVVNVKREAVSAAVIGWRRVNPYAIVAGERDEGTVDRERGDMIRQGVVLRVRRAQRYLF